MELVKVTSRAPVSGCGGVVAGLPVNEIVSGCRCSAQFFACSAATACKGERLSAGRVDGDGGRVGGAKGQPCVEDEVVSAATSRTLLLFDGQRRVAWRWLEPVSHIVGSTWSVVTRRIQR